MNSKKYKKIISMLCIALLTSSILFSYADKNPDSMNENSTTQSDIDANDDLNVINTTSDPRFDIKDDIPELDFNQKNLRFYILHGVCIMTITL